MKMIERWWKIIGLIVVILLATGYSYVWKLGADQMRLDLADTWANAPKNGAVLSPPAPTISGFPGRYIIHWSGNIRTLDGELTAPELNITFFPIPKTSMIIDFPMGFLFESPQMQLPPGQKMQFERLRADIEIPTYIPAVWTKAEVQKLHDTNMIYRLRNLRGAGPITPNGTPEFTGSGEFSFDENLQPKGTLTMTFTNPDAIRDVLVNSIQNAMGKSFANGAINSLSRLDEKTGIRTLPITFQLNAGRIYAGPLQVGYVGTQYWPIDNPPAPDQ
jgi:hypothetical protein